MFSYVASFFSSAQTATAQDPSLEHSAPSPSSPSQPATNPAHAHRNRKKRLAKKKSKQRRRQSTLNGNAQGSDDDDDEADADGDEAFPDADDDLSYIPLEPDNTPAAPPTSSVSSSRRPPPPPTPKGAQPSQIPPQEVLAAVSRLPAPLPKGQRLPNDERAKRIIASQGFVPVEDEAGGLHVGVKVREGVVAVMGPDGSLLFQM